VEGDGGGGGKGGGRYPGGGKRWVGEKWHSQGDGKLKKKGKII